MQGYQPLFMPQLTDVLLKADDDAMVEASKGRGRKVDGYDRTIMPEYGGSYVTSSVLVAGIEQSETVIVIAHVPNYLSDPDNLENIIDENTGNERARVKVPYEEFKRLLDLKDERKVFVIEDDLGSCYGWANVNVILEEPVTIPFFGGKNRARRILRHKKLRSRLSGNEWPADGYTALCQMYYPKEDLEESPIGGLLSLGFSSVGRYGVSIESLTSVSDMLYKYDNNFIFGRKI